MHTSLCPLFALLLLSGAQLSLAQAPVPVPPPLEPWGDWVRFSEPDSEAPPVFDDAKQRIRLWPSELSLDAEAKKGAFKLSVRAFAPTWLTLPGDSMTWPQNVEIDGELAVVVQRGDRPAMKLEGGLHEITGEFPWDEMPQRIPIPNQIGVLALTMNGTKVDVPNWDAAGFLWLKRARAEEAEREFLETRVYRVLEDGIPMWLRTEIELSVAGKSREEDIGNALPEGWTIAAVESKLPAAVNDSGQVKVQVRAGKWIVRIDAFRAAPAETVNFAEGANPIASEETLGFQAKPDFRLVDLENIQAIDVSQTTFPEKWRNLPVYRWEAAKPFRIVEKMRGMGFQKPSGLSVNREFWLDDDGALMTFRDRITGTSQQVWRLDVSPGQTLGAARMEGEGQLITRNPATGASGIEVRQRDINLDAVGRIDNASQFPASGWEADVDSCNAKLHLPPGWRVLAMFGAEWVRGDWLTAWTLLDLFLLLVFTMAVGKLWGWGPALVAMLGFGLTFHEPGAPKLLWFFLLVPLAILRVVPLGTLRQLVEVWKLVAVAALVVVLAPFVGRQIQGVVYPQLEPGGSDHSTRDAQRRYNILDIASSEMRSPKHAKQAKKQVSNLLYDSQARIQTGPAIPSWSWREVKFGWRGPVTAKEQVRVVLIPPAIQRLITVLRVLMLILLVAVLLDAKRLLPKFLQRKNPDPPPVPGGAAVILAFLMIGGAQESRAQAFPPDSMLETLRERLLETSDAFPRAAEIPRVNLTLGANSLKMDAEIHAAALTAVPLPGKLPAWSPVTVLVDGQPAEAAGRRDGYLWVALEPGPHLVQVEGLLPSATEWEWNFLLKPRRVKIEAPNWTITGVGPNGVPENQVFFAVKSPAEAAEAAYDRKDFSPAVSVERAIEVGLVWQVRTTLTRLSPGGKAVALSIPQLPGERMLSSNFTIADGNVEARLGASERTVTWESELEQNNTLALTANASGRWVERWRLIASPVWNVGFTGLEPVYESGAEGLEPVWRPWPGERVDLALSKPEAIPGATMTVRGVEHTTSLGSRQRVSNLRLNLQASLGQDFALPLDPLAEVTGLKIADERNPKGVQQPVRLDGDSVVIPVRPGVQTIDLEWKTTRPIANFEQVDRLELPVESSNISTTLTVPEARWILWAQGPLRGPAVRLWSFVLLALVGAFVLGRLKRTPLGAAGWGLLLLGLTQVHPATAAVVVAWFFLLAWRGTGQAAELQPLPFNLLQIIIIAGAIPVAVILLAALHRGLLGTPEMMVHGNGSTSTNLRWFAQRADSVLPEAGVVSVSIWFYRLLMLAWALWLAASALRWVRWGWEQFSRETLFKRVESKKAEG